MPTSPWLVSGSLRRLASSRRWTALVLVLSTAAFAQASRATYRPEAGSLFASCKAQADGSIGRTYLCPGLTASIAWIQVPPEFSDEQMLEHFRTGIAAMSEGKLESKAARLTLAGTERAALSLTIRAAGKSPGTGHTTLVREDDGGWYLSCLADSSRRIAVKHCERILEFFAAQGVPEPINLKAAPIQPSKPIVGTRELVVPEGCKVMGPAEAGQIQCPSGFLAWMVVPHPPDLKKFRDEQLVTYRKSFQELVASKGAVLTESDVGCRVMGDEGSCRQFRAPIGEGHFRALLGVKRLQAQTIQLLCTQMDHDPGFPAVCNGLMELLPAEAPAPVPAGKVSPAAPK